MTVVLGVDASTTATKAIVVDSSGQVVGVGVSEYDYAIPKPGWTEQDPGSWWSATIDAVEAALHSAGVDGRAVAGIGLTGQMHGSVLLDAAGSVLRPALLWNDQRTAVETSELQSRLGDELLEITGNAAMTGFTAPKLLWVARNEPEIWSQVRHVLLPKDYVRLCLTGDFVTDVADASGTLLFDVPDRAWSSRLVEALDLDMAWLPRALESPAVSGQVTQSAAELLGLKSGVPVAAGAGDQAANAVGVGVVEPGSVALSLGTSGVVFAATDRPAADGAGRVHSFCHAVPNRWHMMGVMLSAAGSLRWFRDTLAPDLSFSALSESAAEIEAGSGGVMFLPYLSGERTPHADPNARAAFSGLAVGHDRRHLTRAVMEGVAYGLRDGLDLMIDAGAPRPSVLYGSGGGLKSSLWRQIVADVLDADVATPSTTEGAAYGAAVLAMVAAGWFATVQDAVAATVTAEVIARPGPDVGFYTDGHRRFQLLYPALHG